jgi:osmoprotectant transport system substrate-binding protein
MDRTKIIALIVVCLVGTACSSRPKITVGSKNFTEQLVLGEIIAQQIERTLDVTVDRKLNLGGTLLAHEALVSGAIDLYPEYTGTALTAVLKREPRGSAAEVFEQVRSDYASKWKLTWLPQPGFNNTFAMVARRDVGITKLSQTEGRSWRLGAGHEFLKRADGIEGLVRTYKLQLNGSPVTMDLGLLYSALTTNKVDLVAANSTDGLLSVLDVRTLEDDLGYFPPYQCGLVVRDQVLSTYPGLRGALERIRISEEEMRRLNHAVDGQHRRIADVAAEFLRVLGQ